jgi:hypothetical protein
VHETRQALSQAGALRVGQQYETASAVLTRLNTERPDVASGGLSPESLVLAGPTTSVLAVAVVTALGPLPQGTRDSWSR